MFAQAEKVSCTVVKALLLLFIIILGYVSLFNAPSRIACWSGVSHTLL